MGATLTYYYNVTEPGTYMYHCHVEATEHMQMGMLGNLYVRPKQNRCRMARSSDPTSIEPGLNADCTYNDWWTARTGGPPSTTWKSRSRSAPSTRCSTTPHEGIQPLPFQYMKDLYPMLNGRGYPDTVNPAPCRRRRKTAARCHQKISSLITATAGQKILLRLSDLNVTRFYTLATTGIPMQWSGTMRGSLRGATGLNLYYDTQTRSPWAAASRRTSHPGHQPAWPAGHVFPVHHQSQLFEQLPRRFRRHDDRDPDQLIKIGGDHEG